MNRTEKLELVLDKALEFLANEPVANWREHTYLLQFIRDHTKQLPKEAQPTTADTPTDLTTQDIDRRLMPGRQSTPHTGDTSNGLSATSD